MKFKALLYDFALLLFAFILAGCNAFTSSTPTPLPTVVLDTNGVSSQTASSPASGAEVAASGMVSPGQEAQLALTLAGKVKTVDVAVGDEVQAGQVLVTLEGQESLQAAVSTAELEVLTAQQALQKLSDDLPEKQTAALQELNDARDALHSAQQKLNGFDVPSEPIDVQVARSNVALAKHALDQATKDFRPYENKPEDNLKRAALLNKLSDAQERYDHAVRQLNILTGTIVPEFNMQQAQTDLEIAQARLKQAQDKYNKLENGPDPDEVALAQARLKNAQDQAQAARASLANLELKAPFAGTVSAVNIHAGEWIIPGQPVLGLADLDHLRIETSDLSERDVPKVKIGQAVDVYIKALDQNVSGHVKEISPTANTLGGDVVYTTRINLDTIPDGVRAGMSVEVRFGTE
jgi:HlyD family secretion protein